MNRVAALNDDLLKIPLHILTIAMRIYELLAPALNYNNEQSVEISGKNKNIQFIFFHWLETKESNN